MWDLTRYKRKKKYSVTKQFEPRINLLVGIFTIFAILIIVKLFDFQVLKFDFYYALASDQHEIYKKIFPDRGSVYLQDQTLILLINHEIHTVGYVGFVGM